MPKPYQVHDKYFQRAKDEGYRARSAFKLLDIQKKFNVIRPGNTVVDLGAAPGSFLQVISKIVGPKGKAIGIDLQEMEELEEDNIQTYQGDVFDGEQMVAMLRRAGFENVDVVTSDLAPKTSGIRDMDQGRSAELAEQAFDIAKLILKPGGHMVVKIFVGEDMNHVLRIYKKYFKDVHCFKPPSVRDRSFETYLIALRFK